jgi:hypothetical protein
MLSLKEIIPVEANPLSAKVGTLVHANSKIEPKLKLEIHVSLDSLTKLLLASAQQVFCDLKEERSNG